VEIGPSVDLLVATLQLKEVQLLRAAMRAADEQGKHGGLPFGPAPSPEPRVHIHPEPQYEPRQVIHPTPRYEPRPVIHPKPRIEQCACSCPPPPPVVIRQEPGELPLKAPWQTPAWALPPQPAPKVKLARPRPDIPAKGLLLDFFI
jgi:hypothetical protein